MTVTPRPAEVPDAAACALLMRAWCDETPWLPQLHTAEEDRAFVTRRISVGRVLVAVEGGGVVGFASYDPGYLAQLQVGAAHRGRGIGARLLDRVKAASPGGFELWTFQANRDALRFYLREGLTEILRTDGQDNEERLPDVRLAWAGSGEGV